MQGFIDGSVIQGDDGIYIVVVAAVAVADVAAFERGIIKHAPHQPFHFHNNRRSVNEAMLRVIGGFQPYLYLAGQRLDGPKKQERARRLCFNALIPVLINDGVDHLTIEHRHRKQDQRDVQILKFNGLTEENYDFGDKANPMLWVADAVAGATRTAYERSDRSLLRIIGEQRIIFEKEL